mmetsp:Transcript_26780/g.44417  ORF Transcript_26780/g.44417 Transcript_26780/m.44417 type:complete len:466 (+) Transcript_26780:61-1458(+)
MGSRQPVGPVGTCGTCGLAAGVLCCLASVIVPALLLLSFESGPDGDVALARPAGYELLPYSDCRGVAVAPALVNTSEDRCAQLCDKTKGCAGFVYHRKRNKCWRKAACSHLRPSSKVSAYLRLGAVRGPVPDSVRWQHNATLVLACHASDLHSLRMLPHVPPLDIVMYRSAPSAAPMSPFRSFGRPVAYLLDLPFPSVPAALFSGLVQLRFTLDFWSNLPSLVLFADGSTYAERGPLVSLPRLQMRLATPAEPPASSAPWHEPLQCLCERRRSPYLTLALGRAGRRADAEALHVWFTAQFLPGLPRASQRVTKRMLANEFPIGEFPIGEFPIGGHFAVSGWRLRQRPRLFYRAWWLLLLVDNKYAGISGEAWAHILQWHWFTLLDFSAAQNVKGLTDPCFTSGTSCNPNLPSRLRARLRARSAELLRSVGESVGEVRERVRGLWNGRGKSRWQIRGQQRLRPEIF